MKYRRKIFVLVLAVLFTLAFRGWNQYRVANHSAWHNASWQSLWTTINFKAQVDSVQYHELCDSISIKYEHFSKKFQSRSRLDSLFYQASKGDTLKVDPEEYALLSYAHKAFELTKQSIHPGIGNLIAHYGLEYGQTKKVPHDSVLIKEIDLLKTLPYELLSNNSIQILQENRHLALGSFSKGYALEWSRKLLLRKNIQNFWLEIGGDLVVNGLSIKGLHWRAGIQNPFTEGQLQGILSLEDTTFKSLATSGRYQQFFIDSLGQQHHHILDPKTAKSASGKASVSVIASNGLDADLWATALFILPLKDGQEILKSNPNIAAFYIFDDSTTWKSSKFTHYTPMVSP